LQATANKNIRDILDLAIEHTADKTAVVVFDERCGLAKIIGLAYRNCLPDSLHIDFDASTPEAVLAAMAPLQAGDLVVLVQSRSFRLEAFRIRVELFKRGLKVIEHPHLSRMEESEYPLYIDALAYDPGYYRTVGPALKERIDRAQRAVIDSGGEQLVYDGPFESAKLNIGDYSTMKNVGGQFPIGEVFTEAKDLETLSGRVRIFVFGDVEFRVNVADPPITLVIERGRIVNAIDSTPDFDQVLAQIQADEELWVRELGFGMNRAFSRNRMLRDVGTYERMCGIHMSIGGKHAIYDKPNLRRKTGKYHVDVFAVTERVYLDDTLVYQDGRWTV